MAMDEFETFCEAVRGLWPRYKTTPGELHVLWVKDFDSLKPKIIARAFELCKREFPNAPGPNWERIIAWFSRRRRAMREERERLERNGDPIPDDLIQGDNWHKAVELPPSGTLF